MLDLPVKRRGGPSPEIACLADHFAFMGAQVIAVLVYRGARLETVGTQPVGPLLDWRPLELSLSNVALQGAHGGSATRAILGARPAICRLSATNARLHGFAP